MTQFSKRTLLGLQAALLAVVLGACDRRQDTARTDSPSSTASSTDTRSGMGTNSSNSSSTTASSGSPNSAASVGAAAGTAIDDSVLTTKVKAALLADNQVKSTDISVETKQGEVLLSGFVDNEAQASRAIQVARGVDGVKNVNNKMSVKG